MLRRALVLSIVLHLAVLLQFAVLPVALPGSVPGKQVVSATLASAGKGRTDDRRPADITDDDRSRVAPRVPGAANGAGRRRGPEAIESVPFAPLAGGRVAKNSVAGELEVQDKPLLTEVAMPNLIMYRIHLARAARQFRQSSMPGAVGGGMGSVSLLLRATPGGAQPDVQILEKSGNDVLDAEAVKLMRGAVSLAPLPDALAGKRFELVQRIEFGAGEQSP